MLAPSYETSASTTAAGYQDGFGRRVLAFDREEGVTLERLHLRAELGAYEAALREACARVALCTDERIGRCRGVERDEVTGDLVMISETVPGERIADLLDAAYDQTRDGATVPGIDVAIGFLLDVLPALAALRATTGQAHGAVGPARTVLTLDGRIVLLECGFADVLQRLRFDRRRLWADFQIAMPPSAGAARFDATADIAQAALTAAMLVTGRPLHDQDYLEAVPALQAEIFEVAQIRGSAEFADGLQRFLRRALPLSGRSPYVTLEAACNDVQQLAGEISHDGCRGALTEYFCQMSGEAIQEDFTFTAAHVEHVRPAARIVEPQPVVTAEWTEPSADWTEPALVAEEPEIAASIPEEPAAPEPVVEELPSAPPPAQRKRGRSERRIWNTLRSIIEPARPEPSLETAAPIEVPVKPAPIEAPVPIAAARETIAPSPFAEFEEPAPTPVAAAPAAAQPLSPLTIERFGVIEEPKVLPTPAVSEPLVSRGIADRAGFDAAAFELAPRPTTSPPPAAPAPIPIHVGPAAAVPGAFTSVPAPTPVSWEPADTPPTAPLAGPPSMPVAGPPAPLAAPGGPVAAPPMPSFATPPMPSFGGPPMPSFPGPSVPVTGPGAPVGGPTAPAPISVTSAAPAPIKLKGSEPVRLKTTPSPAVNSRMASRDVAPPEPGPIVRPAPKSSRGLWKYAAAAAIIVGVAIAAGRVHSPEKPSTVAQGAAPKSAAPTPPIVVATTGTLAIETQPSGVRVLLDGDDVGSSPLTLSGVSAGRHVVTFVTTSGAVKRTVRVEAGKTTQLDVPVFAGWVALFAPIVLEVTEGGVSLGTTEQSRLLLSPGRHELTLTNRQLGYTATHVVNIDPGEERRLTVEPRGTVNLNALPWAEVWIDGNKIGETPLANLQIALGSHEIVFKHPQYGERRVSTTVMAGPPVAISIDLTKPPSQ